MNAKTLRELCELAINTYLYFDTEYSGDSEQSTQAALESIDFTCIAQPHEELITAAGLALHKIEQTLDGQYPDGAALSAALGPLRAALAKAAS